MLANMGLIFHTAAATDVGLGRTNNEDSFVAGRQIAAIADGIGGMPSGELASDLAVQTLAELDGYGGDDPLTGLQDAVARANQHIRELAEAESGHEGMGTTVTALLFAGGRLGLLHVGDSRCYRFRDGQLAQLTKDDTFVQSLVDEGIITAEGARTHPRRSLVTQAVQGLDYQPTCAILEPSPGDRFLLCSDGLSDVVTDSEIEQAIAAAPDRDDCARRLIELALDAGAPDNVTVVIADVVAD
ncbi:MAG TPA: protein phosphatase 2C domain-containing protein [Micromonosporaceae bacterium]